MQRNKCVLCDNNLREFTNFTLFPERYELVYGLCEACYSIQMMRLVNQDLLYNENYKLPDYSTYNNIQHNISFVNFIIKSIHVQESLIEIGSSSFVIGRHLIEYYKDYTVFDYKILVSKKREDVKYIEGNCETFDFIKDSTIIMSHVFEHLYEPKKFINNCKKNNVKNIIISVPDMSNSNIIHVNAQHTFLYSENDIEYIFSLSNYKLVTKYKFNTNDGSFPVLFFHFTLSDSEVDIIKETDTSRHLFTKGVLKPLYVPKKTVLATAGMFSDIIYSLSKNKEDIIGIIDNNTKLHNTLFNDIVIKSYESIKDLDETYSIIVHHPRKLDIINCIRRYNTRIQIIDLSN